MKLPCYFFCIFVSNSKNYVYLCVMDNTKEIFRNLLLDKIAGLERAEIVELLLRNELIDNRRMKAAVCHFIVADICAQGSRKVEAMHAVSEDLGISFATVKQYIYNFPELNIFNEPND